MKQKKFFILSFSFFLLSIASKGQDSLKVYNLDDCIQYALKNNYEVQQTELLQRKTELEHKNAVNQYLPSIEAGVKNNYNWGLFIDPSTNILTMQNTQIWSGGVAADWTLFNGGYNYYNIKQNAELNKAAIANNEFKRNEIRLRVIAAYFQLLYSYEQLNITHTIRAQTENYYVSIKKNVEVGILHKRELLRMETQLALNDVTIVEAQNAVLRNNLILRQTMGLTGYKTIQIDSTISVEIKELQIIKPYDSTCLTGRCFLPEIRRARSLLAARRYSLNIANSYHYPVFFLTSGVQTKSSSLILLDQRQQFKRNLSEFVTFNLKVPIFNKFQTLNAISLSKIDMLVQEKEVYRVSLESDQRIQSAYLDLIMAQKKYWAFHKQLQMQEAQLLLDEKSYANGIISYTDYYYSLNLFNQAKIQLLQAQFDYLYKREVLIFYQGNIIHE